jgi:hypothetical protein
MDTDASEDVLRNIKEYAEAARKRQQDAMELDDQDSGSVEARLSSTINDLQRRLDQRQAELNRVCMNAYFASCNTDVYSSRRR